jgi:hypothetical protein
MHTGKFAAKLVLNSSIDEWTVLRAFTNACLAIPAVKLLEKLTPYQLPMNSL